MWWWQKKRNRHDIKFIIINKIKWMLTSTWFYRLQLFINYQAPVFISPYPPARARTLQSAIGRHGGAAGPETTNPCIPHRQDDREDIAVSGEEKRREGRRFPGGQVPPSLPSIVSVLLSFRPSLPRSPSISLCSLLPLLRSGLRWMDGCMDGCMPCINRWTRIW